MAHDVVINRNATQDKHAASEKRAKTTWQIYNRGVNARDQREAKQLIK